MLGFRGASRYAHPACSEGFALECQAMRRVREQMGLTNVVLMLPFVRRVEEAKAVLERMAELGLERGRDGLVRLRHMRDTQQRDLDRPLSPACSTGSPSAPTTSPS
jgi:phosphoenolpyruvate synthase/pyruvate phosphate dikinase